MFTILPHTADVRLQVAATGQEALFRDALLGMSEIQSKGFCSVHGDGDEPGESIHVRSADMTGLLIDFLSEVLTLSHIQKKIFCRIRFEQLSDTSLSAYVSGLPMDGIDEDIKAVTYHEANIQLTPDGRLETNIVFDI